MSSKYESCVVIDGFSLLHHNYIIIMLNFHLHDLSAKTLLNFLRCFSLQDHFDTIWTRLNNPTSLCGVRAEWNITVSLGDIIKSNDRLDDCNRYHDKFSFRRIVCKNSIKLSPVLFFTRSLWYDTDWTQHSNESWWG